MNKGQESPFATSSKVQRSPQQQKVNPRYPTTYPTERTRSQTTTPPAVETEVIKETKFVFTIKKKAKQIDDTEEITQTKDEETTTGNNVDNTKQDTPSTSKDLELEHSSSTTTQTEQQTDNAETQTTQNISTNNAETQTTKKGEITEQIPQNRETTHNKMNHKEIQRSIASFVPEFSGQNNTQRDNELTRFLGTADSIYETLTTNDERKIFDRLIKFKLTGDAYVRINHKDINDYKTLKATLEGMYTRSQSLDELERNYMNTQQAYGETCRNYGYRIIEAVEKYKEGYKTKYELDRIDDTYRKHLNKTAVGIYKKGINNIILRDKMITSRAENIEEIITESEATERMLEAMADTTKQPQATQQPATSRQIQPQFTQTQQIAVICNYCQKANHTWDVCRTRMFKEANMQRTIPFQRVNYQPNRQNNTQMMTGQQLQQSNSRYNEPARNQPQQYQMPQIQRNQYQPKYCSHCKTTTGHTFNECRSKFLTNRNYQPTTFNRNNYNYVPTNPNEQNYRPNTAFNQTNRVQPPDTSTLEQKFSNMRINTLAPHQQHQDNMSQMNQNQGNFTGSNQS